MKKKSFEMGGHKIKIKYVPSLTDTERERQIFGDCNPMTNVVRIALSLNGNVLAEDVLEHSLWHEKVHLALMLMNEYELNTNEKFVDTMAMLFHQSVKTEK